jgi:hypothetical protein
MCTGWQYLWHEFIIRSALFKKKKKKVFFVAVTYKIIMNKRGSVIERIVTSCCHRIEACQLAELTRIRAGGLSLPILIFFEDSYMETEINRKCNGWGGGGLKGKTYI